MSKQILNKKNSNINSEENSDIVVENFKQFDLSDENDEIRSKIQKENARLDKLYGNIKRFNPYLTFPINGEFEYFLALDYRFRAMAIIDRYYDKFYRGGMPVMSSEEIEIHDIEQAINYRNFVDSINEYRNNK